MSSILKTFILALLSLFCQFSFCQADHKVIKGVSIIDVKSGEIDEDQTVLILNNRISSIGKDVHIPANADVINAEGKFLIPGLWDMHAHNIEIPEINQLFIANGLTGVRDTGGYRRQLEMLDSLDRSGLILPRYLIGHILDGKEMHNHIVVETPSEGVAVVQALYHSGSDFVKPYSRLKPEVFEAIMKEATALGIPAAGHVPDLVHTSSASAQGMKSLEHVAYILKDCTPLRNDLQEEYEKNHQHEDMQQAQISLLKIMEKELSTFDPALARDIAKVLAKNGTAVTPTLLKMYMDWHRPVVDFTADPDMRYVPKHLRDWWDPSSSSFSEEQWATGQKMHPINQEVTRILQEEGVLLLAGTDAPLVTPGFSLHDELRHLVESGLTPLEALQTATLNPAIFLEREDLGSIEENKLADLVLLNSNPLSDISNTKDIYGVFVDGHYLDRKELDKKLEKVAKAFEE